MKLKPIAFRTIVSERGMTVPEVAAKAGLQDECIYTNLRDPDRRIRWSTLWKLCQVLGCEPRQIAFLREFERLEEEEAEREMGNGLE